MTLYLTTADWEAGRATLRERWPGLDRTTITPNRRLTAIEIQR